MRAVDQQCLAGLFGEGGIDEVASRLDSLKQLVGERRFGEEAASRLVDFAGPERALPATMARYQPLVRDGIRQFLAGLSYPRLRRALLGLFDNSHGGEQGLRLYQLARHFPTLHKLGQVVARHPRLDPQLKRWLVGLEHGNFGAEADRQIDLILDQLADLGIPADSIDISPLALAEASVATVVAFCCWSSPGGPGKGVFKVLKPGIGDDLHEELAVLGDTFAWLDRHRHRYGLADLCLSSLFEQIRDSLAREVDLTAEQAHLAEAAEVYGGVAGLRIPRPAPFNSPAMTSMEFIDGRRLGEIELTGEQRLAVARTLFEATICVPLFAERDSALFHGDPHAGNILVVPAGETGDFEVALLDWTLAGHLSRAQRVRVMALLVGIMGGDSFELAELVVGLAVAGEGRAGSAELVEKIASLGTSSDYLAADPLKKTFLLLESMTLAGVVFPVELILFRKAFFTLEGVLHDISPSFAMGEALERYLAGLLAREWPERWVASLLGSDDTAARYRSLLATGSLQELILDQVTGQWRLALERNLVLFDRQLGLFAELFAPSHGSPGWSGRKGQR